MDLILVRLHGLGLDINQLFYWDRNLDHILGRHLVPVLGRHLDPVLGRDLVPVLGRDLVPVLGRDIITGRRLAVGLVVKRDAGWGTQSHPGAGTCFLGPLWQPGAPTQPAVVRVGPRGAGGVLGEEAVSRRAHVGRKGRRQASWATKPAQELTLALGELMRARSWVPVLLLVVVVVVVGLLEALWRVMSGGRRLWQGRRKHLVRNALRYGGLWAPGRNAYVGLRTTALALGRGAWGCSRGEEPVGPAGGLPR